MNKEKVDEMIPNAVDTLETVGIVKAKNGTKTIKKTYRGYISAFGASIMNGSLLAAVAFYSDKGASDEHRDYLMDAICLLLKYKESTGDELRNADESEFRGKLFEYVKDQIDKQEENKCREDIINASIALKLAMNVYVLEGED